MAKADRFTALATAVYQDAIDVAKSDVRTHLGELEDYTNLQLETFGHAMIGGRLSAAVNANALTISVVTEDGGAPDADEPVYFVFRDPTATDGDVDLVAVTSALSLTISAGSTLGVSSSTAFRVWVTAHNDGGTVRLGAVQLFDGSSLLPLEEGTLVTTTAEGGAGGADTAGTIYTGTAIGSSRPFRILGYCTYETGLGTAGMYAAAPDIVQNMGPGVHRPGDLVQRRRTVSAANDQNGTATTIPADNTEPQSSEGDSYLTRAITPTSKANILSIEAKLAIGSDGAIEAIAALFHDGSASALDVETEHMAANDIHAFRLAHEMRAAVSSSRTFSVRAGPESGSHDFTMNGLSGSGRFGAALRSWLNVTELVG